MDVWRINKKNEGEKEQWKDEEEEMDGMNVWKINKE